MPNVANVGRIARPAGLAGGVGVMITALTWASAAPLHAVVTGERLSYDVALGGCAATVAWLALLWFTGCAALTLLARLPGTAGRCAAGLADRVTPAIFRRVLGASLGATLVLTASTQVAMATTTPGPAPAATAVGLLADPDPPVPDRPDVRPGPHRPEAHVVRVRPGDTLWRIARTHLPGRPTDEAISREWHRWYTANRTVIGGDPDLIVPGQRLHPPAP